jgi:2-polyprenyl-3-methyl-5-hydroxy-6-metoxy-1,4-benzoquinol methylase
MKSEKESFDDQAEERFKKGFVSDIRRLKHLDWMVNNVWRDPKYVQIHWLPKIDFVLERARGRVLELGCGTGYLCLEMARKGLRVTGMDVSPKSIEIAQHHKDKYFEGGSGSLNYVCEDFTNTDLGRETYDTVVFFRSFHHIKNIGGLLEKVCDSLTPGGGLLLCEPVRGEFTKESALWAAVLRIVSPTWESIDEKKEHVRHLDVYVKKIFDEYTYANAHQSPHDNDTNKYKDIKKAVSKKFIIKDEVFEDAFIDRLIGGLRGPQRYEMAELLKQLDTVMVRSGALPYTSISMYAVKPGKSRIPVEQGFFFPLKLEFFREVRV